MSNRPRISLNSTSNFATRLCTARRARAATKSASRDATPARAVALQHVRSPARLALAQRTRRRRLGGASAARARRAGALERPPRPPPPRARAVERQGRTAGAARRATRARRRRRRAATSDPQREYSKMAQSAGESAVLSAKRVPPARSGARPRRGGYAAARRRGERRRARPLPPTRRVAHCSYCENRRKSMILVEVCRRLDELRAVRARRDHHRQVPRRHRHLDAGATPRGRS